MSHTLFELLLKFLPHWRPPVWDDADAVARIEALEKEWRHDREEVMARLRAHGQSGVRHLRDSAGESHIG
jgi:hypothetical protein